MEVLTPALAAVGIYAALNMAILIWISFETGRLRGKHKVSIGDGGVKHLVRIMRGHANAVENMPMFFVLMLVAGSLYLAYLFSYLYIWTVSPDGWVAGLALLPDLFWPGASAALFVIAAALYLAAQKSLARPGMRNLATPVLIASGALALVAVAVSPSASVTVWTTEMAAAPPRKSASSCAAPGPPSTVCSSVSCCVTVTAPVEPLMEIVKASVPPAPPALLRRFATLWLRKRAGRTSPALRTVVIRLATS